jgi:hypothetical protein
LTCAAWWIESFYNGGNATFDTVNAAVDSMATAITNHWRTISQNVTDSLYSSNYTDPGYINGTAWEMYACTKIEWQWLLLPAFLILCSALLLIFLIVTEHRHQNVSAWKSSLLPLLLMSVCAHRDERETQGISKSMKNIEAQAEKVMIVLSEDEQLSRLIQVPRNREETLKG